MHRHQAGRTLFWLAVTTLVASCVDGSSPVDVATVHAVQVAAAPVFAVAPTGAEAAAITHARLTALNASGDVLEVVDQDLDPTADEWSFTLELELTERQSMSVTLEIELGSGGEVDWSGRSSPISVSPGVAPQVVADLPIYRGPLADLDVTRVTATAATSLFEGQSTQVEVTLEGAGEGARAYFQSLDPAVATVDGAGTVQTHSGGTARIVALAGPAADTISIAVQHLNLPPGDSLQTVVTPQVEYAADVVGAGMGDAAGAKAITQALGQLNTALSAGTPSDVVNGFQAAVAAWSAYGEGTDLRVLDGPQLGVVELTLIQTADALGIPFE